MSYTIEELVGIYRSSRGVCHLCGGELSFDHYGRYHARDGWEVDHGRPRALGGSDHSRNLLPAHGRCNRFKGTLSSGTVRRAFAQATEGEQSQNERAIAFGAAGALSGALVAEAVWGSDARATGAVAGLAIALLASL